MTNKTTPKTVPTSNAKAVSTAANAKATGVSKPIAASPAATKPSVAKTSTAKANPVDKPKPAITKPVAPRKPAASIKAKAEKVKTEKVKMERDSFTMPKEEYAQIASLKKRMEGLGKPVKKSELLRAGLKLLSAMNDAALQASLAAVPTIKTGRPKK